MYLYRETDTRASNWNGVVGLKGGIVQSRLITNLWSLSVLYLFLLESSPDDIVIFFLVVCQERAKLVRVCVRACKWGAIKEISFLLFNCVMNMLFNLPTYIANMLTTRGVLGCSAKVISSGWLHTKRARPVVRKHGCTINPFQHVSHDRYECW